MLRFLFLSSFAMCGRDAGTVLHDEPLYGDLDGRQARLGGDVGGQQVALLLAQLVDARSFKSTPQRHRIGEHSTSETSEVSAALPLAADLQEPSGAPSQ